MYAMYAMFACYCWEDEPWPTALAKKLLQGDGACGDYKEEWTVQFFETETILWNLFSTKVKSTAKCLQQSICAFYLNTAIFQDQTDS